MCYLAHLTEVKLLFYSSFNDQAKGERIMTFSKGKCFYGGTLLQPPIIKGTSPLSLPNHMSWEVGESTYLDQREFWVNTLNCVFLKSKDSAVNEYDRMGDYHSHETPYSKPYSYTP